MSQITWDVLMEVLSLTKCSLIIATNQKTTRGDMALHTEMFKCNQEGIYPLQLCPVSIYGCQRARDWTNS